MENMMNWLMAEEDGQGMVEYALIIALISVAAVVILGTVGENINSVFTEVAEKIKGNGGTGGTGGTGGAGGTN